MNILLLNWRDVKNPFSGGAEILTHEIAKRLVEKGHKVTWFSSVFSGCKKEEIISGVKVVRDGSADLRALQNSVHFKAYRFYKSHRSGTFDIVIDEIHGMPFFTPLYVKEKKVVLICEVAKNIWDKMFPFPWNIIGKFLERLYFLFYKRVTFLTISNSTKEDLVSYGIKKKKIIVLPMGVNIVPIKLISKEKNPVVIFVGRINNMKGVGDAIHALAIVSQKIPLLKLWLVGNGDKNYIKYLKQQIRNLQLEKRVEWFGFVSERKKFELMAKAWIIIVPSVREGFGLIVPEAGSVETPAVVYDVAGLRDIVKEGVNGIKVPKGNIEKLAAAVAGLLEEKKAYNRLKTLAKKEANSYNWDNTARKTLKVLQSK